MMSNNSAAARTMDLFTPNKEDAQAKLDLQIRNGASLADGLLKEVCQRTIYDSLVPNKELYVLDTPDLDLKSLFMTKEDGAQRSFIAMR